MIFRKSTLKRVIYTATIVSALSQESSFLRRRLQEQQQIASPVVPEIAQQTQNSEIPSLEELTAGLSQSAQAIPPPPPAQPIVNTPPVPNAVQSQAPPQVAQPPPQIVAQPPPQVAQSPPQAVAQPPPQVAQPPPQAVAQPPPEVAQPPPQAVAQPPPEVAQPPPQTVVEPPPQQTVQTAVENSQPPPPEAVQTPPQVVPPPPQEVSQPPPQIAVQPPPPENNQQAPQVVPPNPIIETVQTPPQEAPQSPPQPESPNPPQAVAQSPPQEIAQPQPQAQSQPLPQQVAQPPPQPEVSEPVAPVENASPSNNIPSLEEITNQGQPVQNTEGVQIVNTQPQSEPAPQINQPANPQPPQEAAQIAQPPPPPPSQEQNTAVTPQLSDITNQLNSAASNTQQQQTPAQSNVAAQPLSNPAPVTEQVPPKQEVTPETPATQPNPEPQPNTAVATTEVARPKMHTFFTPVSNKPDTELLEVWKKTWSDAGWEPVVLTLENARNHPDYKRFIEAFESAEYKLKDYDRMCFLRWLAMASAGGGWMSDYDTLPLYSRAKLDGNKLPNDGKFTCYSRHVPNLVSGSQDEWNRMAQLLFFSYRLHPDVFWSDMLSLLEVHDYLDGYVYQKDSIALEKVYLEELQGKGDGKIERPMALSTKCPLLTGMRAIHFSHADCHTVGFCHNNRALALKWIDAWKEKCAEHINPDLK